MPQLSTDYGKTKELMLKMIHLLHKNVKKEMREKECGKPLFFMDTLQSRPPVYCLHLYNAPRQNRQNQKARPN